jgi:hypothetical protein
MNGDEKRVLKPQSSMAVAGILLSVKGGERDGQILGVVAHKSGSDFTYTRRPI